jgi:probable HAF family extracellular repeat protein
MQFQGETHAFLYETEIIDLGALGWDYSGGNGINNIGEVVGRTKVTGKPYNYQYAFIGDSLQGMRRLDTSDYTSIARSINNNSIAVGSINSHIFVGVTVPWACYWLNNNYYELPFTGVQCDAYGASDENEIVGAGAFGAAGNQITRAYLWQLGPNPPQSIELSTIGGAVNEALNINSSGQIVGGASLIANIVTHPVLWSDNRIKDLGRPGGANKDNNIAYSINDKMQIVGRYKSKKNFWDFDRGFRAFLWQNDVFISLDRLIPSQQIGNGWDYLQDAKDINDRCQIVGVGRCSVTGKPDFEKAAFVLTPVNSIFLEDVHFLENGQFKFLIYGPAGLNCSVEATTQLKNPNWILIGSVILTDGVAQFIDTDTLYSSRFYRLRSATGNQLSRNSIGYVKTTILSGYSMIANPLSGVDIRIPALLAASPSVTIVFKWDEQNKLYRTNINQNGVWTDPQMTMAAGEGTIVEAFSPFTLTYTGEVRQNCMKTQVADGMCVRGSQIAVGGTPDELTYPAAKGDKIYLMDTQGNYTVYSYRNGYWTPSTPNIALGASFWSEKSSQATWRQNLSVW